MLKQVYIRCHAAMKASSHAIVLMIGLVFQRIFSIAISIYVARILGAENFGDFTLFVTLFVIFSEIPRAIDNTYIRFANAGSEDVNTSTHLAVNLLLKLVYAMVLVVLINLYAEQFALWVFNKTESLMMIVAGVSIGALYGVYISLPAFFQQSHRFSRVAALRPIYHGLIVLIGVGLYVMQKNIDLQLVIEVHLVMALILCIIALSFLVQHVAWQSFIDYKLIKAHLRIASIIAFAMLISLCAARLDIFIIRRLLSLEELGRYGVAVRTAMIASIFTGVIATIMLPQAAQALATRGSYKRYMRLARFYLIMQIFIAIIIVIFCKPIVSILFGVAYEGGEYITALLVIQMVFTACAVPYRALIQCSTSPSVLVVIASIALCLNAFMMFKVIPHYGVIGVASCMVITALIALLMIMFASAKLTNRYFLRVTLQTERDQQE